MYEDIKEDSIVAISTPMGKGAIAIVRVSGKESIKIVDSIFRGKKKLIKAKGNRIYFGKIIDENGKIIDQVLVSIFRAPKSFTGEDLVEINCHGGVVIPNIILNLLIKKGARLAYNGEFTKRAFLNGKIDIIQAEAINDIINSTTLAGVSLGFKNLNGNLSSKIQEIRENLLNIFSEIEVTINYPEEDLKIDNKKILKNIQKIIKETESMISKNKSIEKIFKGFRVVIAGRTNVGKSSLLNYLAGEEKAIVSHIHGTTRDIIEVEISIDNIPIILIDTAGIRNEYENEIEGYGIIKAKENIKKSDLIIFIFEADRGLTEEDKNILRDIDKNIILVGNKADLGIKDKIENALYLSVKEGKNINKLIEKIKENLDIKNIEETDFYINSRQKEIMEKFIKKLKNIKKLLIKEDATIDIISFNIQDALTLIDRITGKELNTDLLNNIFSRFCVGK